MNYYAHTPWLWYSIIKRSSENIVTTLDKSEIKINIRKQNRKLSRGWTKYARPVVYTYCLWLCSVSSISASINKTIPLSYVRYALKKSTRGCTTIVPKEGLLSTFYYCVWCERVRHEQHELRPKFSKSRSTVTKLYGRL